MADVYTEIAKLESAKYAEEQAQRQAIEAAAAKKRADQERDARLAQLKAQAARQELNQALDSARASADLDKQAVLALRDALAELVSVIVDTMTPPLSAAETAFNAATRANQNALIAGDDLQNNAPPTPPVRAAADAPEWMQREAQIDAAREARGQALGQLPPLYTPDMAALIGMAGEKDDRRKRVWAALAHIITGMPLVYTDERYSPEDDARQRLRRATRSRGSFYA
jgi:hypothetical protein